MKTPEFLLMGGSQQMGIANHQQRFGPGLSGYVAEMASAFMCASLGITPTVRHADYLGSWLEVLKEDNRAIFRAASQASKAADFILAFRDGDPAPPAIAAEPVAEVLETAA